MTQTPIETQAPTDAAGAAARLRALQALYTRRAAVYDVEPMPVAPLRREAIAALTALGLSPSQTVLDLGSGTGLSLPGLAEAVGPDGRIVAVEPCPAMMAQARQRMKGMPGSPRIDFIGAPAEAAPLDALIDDGGADAALFFFTHDLLQQPEALARAMRALRPGAPVVAAGLVWASPWWPLSNLFVWGAAMHSIIDPTRLDRPWHDLAPRLSEHVVERRWLESAYLLRGRR